MNARIAIQFPVRDEAERWASGVTGALPEASVRVWAPGDDAPADYALVWKTPSEFFRKPRGLRAVFALGAGVDALLPVVPQEIPLVRLDDAGMAAQMAAYVARELFALHPVPGDTADWDAARLAHTEVAASPATVGVLGLGVLGAHVAGALAALGFSVHGWSRSPKSISGVVSHTGDDGLDALLETSSVLVNLLPLTRETEGVLSTRLFDRLPRGARLINVARGAHLVDADLLAALDCGKLSGATLDVFRTEPLPKEHPFWSHPKVRVTPHVSARTLFSPSLEQIVAKIRLLESGAAPESLAGFVDRGRGY